MKKRNVLFLTLILMVSFTLVIAGCGKTEEKTLDTNKDNTSVGEKNLDNKKEDENVDTDNSFDAELLTEENYKMHSKITTPEDKISIEMIIQKKGNNIAIEYINWITQDMIPGVKMKKTIIIDGKGSYVNYEIKDKDIWTKIMNTDESNTPENIANWINPKKLLAKFKKENVEKTEKEVNGDSYDCYNQNGENICFDDDELKYILGSDGSISEIIEYSDDIDSDAFDVPADDKLTSQAEMNKIIMKNHLPAEATK